MQLTKRLFFTPAFISIFFFSASVQAGSVTPPNTFEAGHAAVAAEVNDNFTALADEINDNDSRITTNNSAIHVNTGAISTVRGTAQNNADAVTTNSDGIQVNSDAIDIINSRIGVRMSRLWTGSRQGNITLSDSSTWYDVTELGDFEKTMDNSLIDLCYQSHASLVTDGTYQNVRLNIYLENLSTHTLYESDDAIVFRDYDDIGRRYQTLSLNASYTDVPAGNYRVHLRCRGNYASIHVNPGNFSSTCVLKEMPLH